MSTEGGKSFEGLFIDLHIKGDLLTDFSSSLLQGMLVFAESTGLPVSMYFDEPGRWAYSLTDFKWPHELPLCIDIKVCVCLFVCVRVFVSVL